MDYLISFPGLQKIVAPTAEEQNLYWIHYTNAIYDFDWGPFSLDSQQAM